MFLLDTTEEPVAASGVRGRAEGSWEAASQSLPVAAVRAGSAVLGPAASEAFVVSKGRFDSSS